MHNGLEKAIVQTKHWPKPMPIAHALHLALTELAKENFLFLLFDVKKHSCKMPLGTNHGDCISTLQHHSFTFKNVLKLLGQNSKP